jgi:hypothetical protein
MIRLVLNEKKSLSESCKAIAEELEGKALLADGDWNNRSRINKLLIDISLHLGNIAGFCDKTSKKRIKTVTKLISVSMVQNTTLYYLKSILPAIAGMVVDYNKKPFRLVRLSIPNLAGIEFRK